MENSTAHFQLVKNQNKKIIRNILRQCKQAIGVSALAKETGLSYPTVLSLLKELMATGEVKEIAETVSQGGRPAAQYILNSMYKCGAILILEEEVIAYVIVDAFANVLEQGTFVMDNKNITIDWLMQHIKPLKATYESLATIAMGIPGIAVEGEIRSLDIFPELQGKELADTLKKEYGIQLVVENDSNAMALSQINGKESFAQIVYLRHCVGVGIVINGALFRGKDGCAGEMERICPNLLDPIIAMSDVIKYITGVLNLGKVYIASDSPLEVEKIRSELAMHFSYCHIPEIEIIHNAEEIYKKGLIERLLIIWREEIV
ncbi:ROK family protein [Anaerosporobacter faecicola]|uniref:ROK family protein n=1 Tax=Anaerosporobacter faecicola TaxID=2718714 RepID=UPI00143B7DC3|nr:ROK family protein [Anaerosporobacter faecicola]